MPVYEQSYRRYAARAPLRQLRAWPIAREALRLVLSRRVYLGLLALAWLPFVVRVVQVWAVTRFPEASRILPTDGRMFGEFLNQQLPLTLLVVVFGGAGLIANDMRTGGILVYLSRPLTRLDYIGGKLAALFVLAATTTLAPALALYLTSLTLAPEQFAVWTLIWLGPAVVLHATTIALTMSLLMLAVSSLCRSARVAGLGFVGLWVGLAIARGLVRHMWQRSDHRSFADLISVQQCLQAVSRALFGLPERSGALAWGWPALALLLVCVGCLLVLRSRVRAVEIVR